MARTSEGLTKLELSALVAATSSHPDKAVRDLFYKIPLLRVKEREMTGVGFYTTFSYTELDAARSSRVGAGVIRKPPPEAVGFHPDFEGVTNFLVWLEDGHIACLEAASTHTWPDDESGFVVSPFPEDSTKIRRDMAELADLHKITAAQTLRMLALQEAQLRELTERVRVQDAGGDGERAGDDMRAVAG